MSKLKISQEPMSTPPSELAAAPQCSTETGTELSPLLSLPIDRVTVLILLAALDSLCKEVMSGDKWYLAMGAAQDKLIAMGLSEEKVTDTLNKILEHRYKRSQSNPMKDMYD